MKRQNKMKAVLKNGEAAIGCCVDSYSPAIVEITGYSGLDFVRIDTEYSWRRDDALEHMMRAATIADITPMIRVEKNNRYLISKALQIGAQAILVSDIESLDEAVDVVKSSKFAPQGFRGYSSFSYSAGWGTKGGEQWVKWSNTDILVGIMIENKMIVEKIDDIFSIDGLDFCFFGPADYCMSLGLGAPQKGHPEVENALIKTIESAKKFNKYVGVGIDKPWGEAAQKYIDMGCGFLELGHDLGILKSELTSAVKIIKK